MPKIKTFMYPIEYTIEGNPDIYGGYIGLVKGGWDDILLDTETDHKVYYFVDSLEELRRMKVGEEICGDDDYLVSIGKKPEYISIENLNDEGVIQNASI
jgi:hypothetical protein